MTAITAEYRRHRARQIAYGRWHPWGDLDQVRAHVAALHARGHTLRVIATAAGLSEHTAARALHPGRARIPAHVAEALLGAEPARACEGYVSSLGAARRLRALSALGWPRPAVAREAGLSPATLGQIPARRWVTAATHRAVAGAYDRLCMTPGPSAQAASRARGRGWAPPLAWGEDIDDPAARPVGMRRTEERAC